MGLPAPFTYATTADVLFIVIGSLAAALGGAMLPLFLSYLGDILDTMNGIGGKHSLKYYCLFQICLGLATWVCCFFSGGMISTAGERQIKRLNSRYMKSILRQEMAWFDSQESGRLAARAAEGISNIRGGLGVKFAQLIFSISLSITGYIIAFFKCWKVALVVSATLPVNAFASVFFFKSVARAERLQRSTYEAAAEIVQEALLAIRTVVSFSLEGRFSNLFSEKIETSSKTLICASIMTGVTFTSIFAAFYFTEALGYWYGARLVSNDLDKYGVEACYAGSAPCLTGGKVLAVFFTIITSIFAMAQCTPCLNNFAQATSAVKSFMEVSERKSLIEPDDPNQPDFGDEMLGHIQFKNVSFRYPTRQDCAVYSHLNLTIKAGTTVALVGASGCGKSTIVQILQRFYDIESGSESSPSPLEEGQSSVSSMHDGFILIDGKNLKEYNLTSIRKHIAIVSQEPRLFASTVMENIRVGKLEATDEECKEAARQANAHGFIMDFPQQYMTYVGEGGGQLSGGQKQRIALARAILRNPAILILDEATSALDNESERIVQKALDNLLDTRKRTTLIIAHRLTTIRYADKIVVFEKLNGVEGSRIIEQGDHDQLMQFKGTYAALVDAQSLAVKEDAAELATGMTDIPAKAASLAAIIHTYSKASIGRKSKEIEADEIKGLERTPYRVPWTRQFSLLCHHPWLSFFSILGGFIDGVIMPVYCIIFAQFNDTLFFTDSNKIRTRGLLMALILCILGITSWFFGSIRYAGMLSNTSFVTKELRVKLFTQIVHQDMAFFDNPTVGGIAYIEDVMAADPRAAAKSVCNNVVIGASAVSAMIAGLVIAFMASVKLAAVALAAFFFIAPGAVLESQINVAGAEFNAEDFERGKIDIQSTAYVLLESMLNLKTVEAYSLQKFMGDRYDVLLEKEEREAMKKEWMASAAWGLSQFLQFGAQAVIFYYGGTLVSNGELDTAQMFRGSMSIIMAAMTLGIGAYFAGDTGAGKSALSRIYEILDRRSRVDVRDEHGFKLHEECGGLLDNIHFDSVTFSYPMRPNRPVYKDLSFTCRKGETVALVGASGTGKSTAVQLLEKFYLLSDNDSVPVPVDKQEISLNIVGGRITVDGKELSALNTRSWRNCIGIVQQEPTLFTTSVRENIELGKWGEKCTNEEIIDAAKLSNSHEFVSKFDNGYETSVGTRGGQISGGQKQRIAVARGLIRRPSILILDEATSALDAESERIVQEALDRVIGTDGSNRTTIVIAHRLSTIRNSSKIVVLKNDGEGSYVAEVGTHDELIQNPTSVYHHLAKAAER